MESFQKVVLFGMEYFFAKTAILWSHCVCVYFASDHQQ
jgi:hypothetical protein